MFCHITLNNKFKALMIFGPAIAFAAVTEFPAWLLVLIVGLVCTIYTSVGGLIAVVINDSIQVSKIKR